jgi:hypothetical protein
MISPRISLLRAAGIDLVNLFSSTLMRISMSRLMFMYVP